MALFDTNAFRISEQGLSVLWQKQQIIAENIANADTPDYNCKYLDFAGIFRDKLRSNGTVDASSYFSGSQAQNPCRASTIGFVAFDSGILCMGYLS